MYCTAVPAMLEFPGTVQYWSNSSARVGPHLITSLISFGSWEVGIWTGCKGDAHTEYIVLCRGGHEIERIRIHCGDLVFNTLY